MSALRARGRQALPYLLLLVLSGALYASALQIDTSGTAGGQRIGPDFWPKLILAVMAGLCVFEICKRLFATDPGQAESRSDPEPETVSASTSDRGALVRGIGLIAGFVLLVPWMGFFLTTICFLGGFIWIGGYRRPGVVALTAVLGSLLLMVVFMRLAYVSLPLGAGPFRELSLMLLHALGVR